MRLGAVIGVSSLLLGCQSYDIVQTNVFSDDDGNVVTVDYGRSDEDHVNTFVNPATGETMEFSSKLVVDVTLPNGKDFTAWQCMNFTGGGTMYKTDNEEWMIRVNGVSSIIFQRTEKNPPRYHLVYKGTLCASPKVDYEPNSKWRTLTKDAQGIWK